MDSSSSSSRPDTDLYALLNVSPDASSDDIRRAFYRLATHAHPDKNQDPQLLDVANENFRRIREAYDILSDERKRAIYDVYGIEGINSGLEVGEHLSKKEEIIEELERLRRLQEESKFVRPRAGAAVSILADLSLPNYVNGGPLMSRMLMSSEVGSQMSKRNSVNFQGNMLVSGQNGAGSATAAVRHHFSPATSVDLIATAGLRSLIAVQATRHLSKHSSATLGLAASLANGSLNLSNTWTRRLSDTCQGNIHLSLGTESAIAVGWKKKDETSSASGELKIATTSIDASAHYTHHFSKVSHGRVSGSIGSSAVQLEIGGGRRISEFSLVRMLYCIGHQGISWKFELHYGDQKLIIPVLLSSELSSVLASSLLVIPSSVYFLLKKFVIKPYQLRREQRKAHRKREKSFAEVQKAKDAAMKAQKLLENAANRNKVKETNKLGLVITKAIYGNLAVADEEGLPGDDATSQALDVTLPLNFLVNDSRLELHEGIKKSGIMGFCDPCPGTPKRLRVEYEFKGQQFKVEVDDYEALKIPQAAHQI